MSGDPLLPTGSRRCQCGRCELYFRSVSAFDRHRVTRDGNRVCRTAAELEDLGFQHDERGIWRGPPRRDRDD